MSDNYYQDNDSYPNNQGSSNRYSLNESQLNEPQTSQSNQYGEYSQYGQSNQTNSYYNQYEQQMQAQSGYQNSQYGAFQNNYYAAQQKTVLNGGYSSASEATVREVLTNSFLYMFLGLLVTGIISTFFANKILETGNFNVPAFFVALALEFVVVIAAQSAMKNNNVTLSYILFFAYSAINGFTLSIVLIAYTSESVVSVFFICAAVFGVMAAFGALTKLDLTNMGSILMVGLFGLIIACIINIFLGSERIDYIISIVGVVIFVGLTAYDTQKIKTLASTHTGYSPAVIGIWGALELYLDFINLFLKLLRLLGKRR